jgi:hypothetical protein
MIDPVITPLEDPPTPVKLNQKKKKKGEGPTTNEIQE